jgi:phosphate starvation-inducible PhoH-like protein
MMMWLGGAIPVFKERLGQAMFEIALEKGDIEFVPLEVVKGMSVNDAFMLCEESSDLTKDEVIKLVTRMGRNSTLVLAGDIRQSELRGDGGLAWLQNFINRHQMQEYFGSVDFNDVNDIVRSEAVKRFITGILRDEKKGIN